VTRRRTAVFFFGWRVTATAVGASIILISLVVATAPASASTQSPQQAAMAELMRSYSQTTGRIGGSWWQAGVALSTLETYAQTTGDSSYDYAIARAFSQNSGGDFEDKYDDDTGWWGLAWLQAYQMTGNRSYLSMAETDAAYIHQDWTGACGGGVWWLRSPASYKNAIANEVFLELSAWLHNTIRGDRKYLRWAKAEWSWFRHSGMINASGTVNDGLTASCQNNGENTWTYNQGVILAGLAQLYQATKNRELLREAERIAQAAISHLTVDGVLTEACQAGCGADAQSFKGIFIRDLKVLAVTAKTTQFNEFFRRQARTIEADDSTSSHQLGMFWAGPAAQLTPASQASGLDALVASLRLPR
jgi:Glycosyl hydrolase family 76